MTNTKQQFKKILLSLPAELYSRLKTSELRRNCSSDTEAIRSAIRTILNSHSQSQEKSDEVQS